MLGTSARAIARAGNFNQASIYYHFGSIDEVVINATDLGVMQKLIGEVPGGRFVEMPETAKSFGHQTLAHPDVWTPYLEHWEMGVGVTVIVQRDDVGLA